MEPAHEPFEDTHPLGAEPPVDFLLSHVVDRARRSAPRQSLRPITSGLEFLRDLLTYRFG
jgi:hypothetical protein